MIDIEKILPIWKVENGTMISMQGDVTIAYKVELPETGTLSADAFEVAHQAFVKAIRVLQEGMIVHKADWYQKAKVKADFISASESPLSFASEKHFNERPYLDHSCYIFLTQRPLNRKLSSSAYCNILRKSIAPAGEMDERLLRNFQSCAGQFETILTDSGLFNLQRLDDDELAGSANSPGIIEKYCFLLGGNEAPLIRDVHIRDGIRVGDKQVELYCLSDATDLPSFCGSRINYDKYSTDKTKYSIGFASPLGQFLDCNHIFNQFVFISDSRKTLKALEAKKLRLHSLSAYSRENAISRDACNDFLNEAIGQQRLPVKAHFNVMAWSDDLMELAGLKNKVGSAMAAMDAVCKQETDGAAQLWFSAMPGNAGDFPMNETFDTFAEQASCFFNIETSYRSSISPFGLRLGDRISGKPLHVDVSDEPMKRGFTTNRNKFVIGPSGSGKSFFTNHMVRSYYEQGAHQVIVDVGHSYKGLCDLVGGYYFTYSENNPIRFNPFYIGEGDELDTEKKESIKTLLITLWKKDDERYTRAEYVAVSNALSLYYDYLNLHQEIFPCFNSFYEFLMEEYLQVLEDGKVQQRNFDIDNFLYVLNPYYKGGEFDYLLNATENLDLLHQRLVIFEIDKCKDHPILFPVVTIIIMEMFISKMRKLKGIRKVLLLEEVWKSIAKDSMATYIQYLFKTVRKFFGEAIVVTQEIEDILSSVIVKKAIIGNADCKILLDQSKYQNKFDEVQALLGLSDLEKTLVMSMNKANDPTKKYKEVFISLGTQCSKVYRTEVSLSEYLAYTTEESEKIMVQAYADKYGDIARGIAVLAAELLSGKKIF
ncbi:TraG family conjugative transposon ATPase [Pedobacter helvus]|uniref:TraG family conjugative transposon ATPase n=1 Tax=Pedobacter helvus TaxID=2563444 RepID=A0ABW9JCK0_9SPHI|nr:TraG family conjugative transposon ATPase [Pedobacter ureilyticus]